MDDLIVSIQLLLLFYEKKAKAALRKNRFNTTFVTVLSERAWTVDGRFTVSIQLLLLFYLLVIINSYFFNDVSIQLLLLFYKDGKIYCGCFAVFQYNFCYCSISSVEKRKPDVIMFQYNFCYCSMTLWRILCSAKRQFQYNFCYCSIYIATDLIFISLCFNTTFVTVLSSWNFQESASLIVSIQLLLLFYALASSPWINPVCVSIQLLLLFYSDSRPY